MDLILRSTVALVAVLAATVDTHHIPNVGRCNPKVLADSSVDFEQAGAENNGFWIFLKVPDTETFRSMSYMHLHIDRLPYPRLWNDSFHYRLHNGSKGVLAREIVYDHRGGVLTTYNTNGVYFKVVILRHERNRYGYYYVCSDHGDMIDLRVPTSMTGRGHSF